MKKTFKSLFFIYNYLFVVASVYAADVPPIGLNLGKQGDNRGIKLTSENPDTLFGVIFKNIIVLLFTIGALGFIIMFLWGAVSWILSGGDKEKIAGARKRIVTAVTGLVLLALTFVITVVIGQILGLKSLRELNFPIPQLTKGD